MGIQLQLGRLELRKRGQILITKTCSDCHMDKLLTEYHKHKTSKFKTRPNCKLCRSIQAKIDRAKPAWREREKATGKKWQEANKEKLILKRRNDYLKNKASFNARSKAWYEANKSSVLIKDRNRKLSKIQRTPKWLTPQDFWAIEQWYTIAKELSIAYSKQYEVDHIVPLHGQKVSGLHVPWNLQVLSAEENRSKGNKY